MFRIDLSSTRWGRSMTVALIAGSLAAPAAAAGQDLRSPDAKDAARSAEARGPQDLRSPDAQDAARSAEARDYQDLRSPDAVDAATVGERPDSSVGTSSSIATEPGGFDWSTAGITIAALAGLLILALAGLGVVRPDGRRVARS